MKSASVLLVVFVLAACTQAPERPDPEFTPEGPPSIRSEVVDRHAEQFETDLRVRPPGSQEEFAAATYITGHLQQAGYVVRLESIPLRNTIRSSDVLGLPPSGDDPAAIVAVSYDAPETSPGLAAREIGAFLELARALRVRSPEHDIEFAALGAQSEDELGARRLAQILIEADVEPRIVYIAFSDSDRGSVPLAQAGFDVTVLEESDIEDVAIRLLEDLTSDAPG